MSVFPPAQDVEKWQKNFSFYVHPVKGIIHRVLLAYICLDHSGKFMTRTWQAQSNFALIQDFNNFLAGCQHASQLDEVGATMPWPRHSLHYTGDEFLSIRVRISRDEAPHGWNIMQQWVEWTSLQVVLSSCPMYWAFSSLSGSLLFCSFLPKLMEFLGMVW